jgi:hypothetical protein
MIRTQITCYLFIEVVTNKPCNRVLHIHLFFINNMTASLIKKKIYIYIYIYNKTIIKEIEFLLSFDNKIALAILKFLKKKIINKNNFILFFKIYLLSG